MKTSTLPRMKPWFTPEESCDLSQKSCIKSVYIMHGNSVNTQKSVLELMYTKNEFCKSLSTGEFKW